MKLTHFYNAPILMDLPENPRPEELQVHAQTEADRRDLMAGQLSELGRTLMLKILDSPGAYIVEWQEPEEVPVDAATVRVTLGVDVKRYHEPKKEEGK
jgi:hypothetical protein